MSRLALRFGIVFMLLSSSSVQAADFTQADAAKALRRAVEFFRTQIALEGGYVYSVSEDLKKREGEHKITPTQVWIQPPSTSTVGITYLEIYRLTQDEYYLQAARETAECLIRGQLQSGGWYVSIDLDQAARRKIAYRDDPPAGKAEKLANRSTLDDDKTQSCIKFLMRLDEATSFRDAKLHEATLYALDALVKVQFPNGAWPQQFSGPPDPAEFPVVKASYPKEWSRTFPGDHYASHYTFNDGSIADVVNVMLEASHIYAEPRYRQSAERAGDFILLAQLPEPQPAWAQQYDAEMHPAWARKFEPPSITGGESQGIIQVLLDLYSHTGEKRFLEPIPRALAYLKRSQLADGKLARFYELQTNKPLYFTKDYVLTYSDADVPTHYGFKVSSKWESLRQRYEQLVAVGPNLAPPTKKPRPDVKFTAALAAEAQLVAAALDERGAWVEDGELRNFGSDDPTRRIITSRTFVKNALTLARAAAAK